MAVPLFFVISGFCIHLAGLSRPPGPAFALNFYLERLIRIYPAWLVAVAFSAIVLAAMDQEVSFGMILSHLTLTNGFVNDYRLNAALWSVSVECFLYLLYPAWLSMRRRLGLSAAALASAMVCGMSCIATSVIHPEASGPAIWFFLNVWSGWVAGAVLAEIWMSKTRMRLTRASWWILGLVAASLHIALSARGFYVGPWKFFSLPITISLFVWPLALLLLFGESLQAKGSHRLTQVVWRAMVSVGAFSYSLYLLHIPLQSLRLLVWSAVPSVLWVQAFVLAAWLGLVLAVAWICYRWVELPASRIGRRLLGRAPEPTLAVSAASD